MADLENYQAIRRRPLARDWRGARIFTNPPPSSGGPLIAFALAMLEQVGRPPGGPHDPGWLMALADAMARLIRAPGLRRRLGSAGRLRVTTEFRFDRAIDRLQHRLTGAAEQAGS